MLHATYTARRGEAHAVLAVYSSDKSRGSLAPSPFSVALESSTLDLREAGGPAVSVPARGHS